MSEPESPTTSARLRVRGSPVRFVLVTLVAYLVVGAVAGAVWEWVWTPPDQVVRDNQVFYTSYQSLRRVFTGTGLYVVVGGVAAALMSLVVCLLARGRELVTLATVVVGSCAAAAMMRLVGGLLGPDDPLTAAKPADTQVLPGQLTVHGFTPYLVWPMVTLFVLAVVFFAWPSAHQRDDWGAPQERDDLGAAPATRRDVPTELPADRQRLVDQIRSVQFTPTRIRQGYEMTAVDALLDRAVGSVRRGESLGPVLDVELPTVTWREGYHMAQVRSFLDGLRESADGLEPRR
jgi:DivIVA domain-containing protein